MGRLSWCCSCRDFPTRRPVEQRWRKPWTGTARAESFLSVESYAAAAEGRCDATRLPLVKAVLLGNPAVLMPSSPLPCQTLPHLCILEAALLPPWSPHVLVAFDHADLLSFKCQNKMLGLLLA